MLNKTNLLKLADYLESLPENYKHFEMSDYLKDGDKTKYSVYALHNGGVATTCGAAACAIGHGPSAGFLFLEEELDEDCFWDEVIDRYVDFLRPDWNTYAERNFCDEDEHYNHYHFMFGGSWKRTDNTPWGAAARIRYVCDDNPVGEADEWHDTKCYQPYHKKNRAGPTLFQRITAFMKG